MFSTRKRRGGSGVAVEVGDDVEGGEALEGAHYVSQSHLESARASFVHFYTEYGVKRPDELQSCVKEIMAAMKRTVALERGASGDALTVGAPPLPRDAFTK